MESGLTFRTATRKSFKPLIGLYAESGCGKTFSALLLARGIAGPNGRIALVDTEAGRGSLYSDCIPGGYETLEMEPPFRPQRFIEIIDAAEKQGIDVLILDSMSHEWDGVGGVLDWAADNEDQGKKGQLIWKAPKMEHNMMVLRIMQSKLTIICCLQAVFKTRQVLNEETRRKEIVKDSCTSPIQNEKFIFSMTAHAEIFADHTINLTKWSHPNLKPCFPENRKEPISIRTGELIAQWCNGVISDASVSPDKAKAKKQLWDLVKSKFETASKSKLDAVAQFEEWLRAQGLIDTTEALSDLGADRLTELHRVISKQQGEANA